MEKSYELTYHALEENHWWFVARRDIILKLIRKLNIHKTEKILEIGCSGGPLMRSLKNRGFTNLYGIDISHDAIDLCKARNIENVAVMDGAKTQFKNEEFDVIIASDVLEHIEDDSAALAEWYRILKPNGKLLLFVPVHSFLWSSHDEVNKHFRRYAKVLLMNKLEKEHFIWDRISYWNFILFFPIYVLRTLQRLLKRTSVSKNQLHGSNRFIDAILVTILKMENLLLEFIDFPMGVSLFAVCRK